MSTITYRQEADLRRTFICSRTAVFFSVLSLILFSLADLTCASGAGTTGGNILNFGVGARALAMGEAYTAQSDDVSSLYWNPAGLAILNQSQASFMYNSSVQGLSFQNASVATPLESGGIGASLSYLSFGKIAGYDQFDNPTDNVSAYSGVGTLGGAWFNGPWALGVNAKGVRASLADVSANGFAADLGTIYTHQQEVLGGATLRGGLTIRNLGTGLKFIEQKDPFPTEVRAGVALVQLLDKKLNASFDIGKQQDVRMGYYTGLEYWLIPMLAIRGGFVGTAQEGNGLRAGIGLRVKDFSFDYAYSSYGDLGMAHRYELSMKFGVIRPTLTPEEREMLRRAKLAMARQNYGEATMLFDSLITMVPEYRPLKKLVKTAMKGYEGQEKELAKMEQPYHLNLYGPADNTDPEVKELATMLDADEGTRTAEAPKVPEVGAAAPSPAAEENTLAPFIPSVDPHDPLKQDEQAPEQKP